MAPVNRTHINKQLQKNKERKDVRREERKWLKDNFLLPRGVHKPDARIIEAREKWIEENPNVTPPWLSYSRG